MKCGHVRPGPDQAAGKHRDRNQTQENTPPAANPAKHGDHDQDHVNPGDEIRHSLLRVWLDSSSTGLTMPRFSVPPVRARKMKTAMRTNRSPSRPRTESSNGNENVFTRQLHLPAFYAQSSNRLAKNIGESVVALRQMLLQLLRAITLPARPRLLPIFIPAF